MSSSDDKMIEMEGGMMHNKVRPVETTENFKDHEPELFSTRTLWIKFVTFYHSFVDPEPGVKTAAAKGFYAPEDVPKVLTYQPGLVRYAMAPFISRDMTVCNSLSSWIYHLSFVAYTLFLMWYLIRNEFPDNEHGATAACSSSAPRQNRNMCQLNTLLEDSKAEFRFLIAFILAGYVGMAVAAWEKRRKNYASLCGNARNLNIQLQSVIPLDADNDAIMQLRKRVGRWVMLAMELAVLKARNHMDSDEGRDHLEAAELTVDGEWDCMVAGDRHSTVFWWIASEIMNVERHGIIDVNDSKMIVNSVGAMRAQANDLMSSLDRDRPYSYTALCGVLAVEWSIWFHSVGQDEFFTAPRFWVDLFMLFSWNLSYASLYYLGAYLYNPFGNRRIDVAHEVIFNGIRKLSTELAIGSTHLPPNRFPTAKMKSATEKAT